MNRVVDACLPAQLPSSLADVVAPIPSLADPLCTSVLLHVTPMLSHDIVLGRDWCRLVSGAGLALPGARLSSGFSAPSIHALTLLIAGNAYTGHDTSNTAQSAHYIVAASDTGMSIS
jgi:hypothetical protein